jgi:hypothetical protein
MASSSSGTLKSFILIQLPIGLKQLCYSFFDIYAAVAMGTTNKALRAIIIGLSILFWLSSLALL